MKTIITESPTPCSVMHDVTESAPPPKASVDVVMVDDDRDLLTVVMNFFRRHGLSITTTAKADEALYLSDEKQVGLMVVDADLAGEDGGELLSFLHANHPEVPIILYTGQIHSPEQIADFQERGATRYMNKGGSPAALLETVREICSGRNRH